METDLQERVSQLPLIFLKTILVLGGLLVVLVLLFGGGAFLIWAVFNLLTQGGVPPLLP